MAGYYDDQKLSQIDPSPATDPDPEIKRRYERFSQGKRVRLFGPLLSSGITQCHKVLPSLTHLKIKMTKSDAAFHVIQPATIDGDFFLKIDEAVLNLKR